MKTENSTPQTGETVTLTVGTAGHIDHGKTELVKYLTGCNTDRLPENVEPPSIGPALGSLQRFQVTIERPRTAIEVVVGTMQVRRTRGSSDPRRNSTAPLDTQTLGGR